MHHDPRLTDPAPCRCGRVVDRASEDVVIVDGVAWCGRCDEVTFCCVCDEPHAIELMTPADDADTAPHADHVCAEPSCQDRHRDALANALHEQYHRDIHCAEAGL